MPFATLVSNNCAALVADWQTYGVREGVQKGRRIDTPPLRGGTESVKH